MSVAIDGSGALTSSGMVIASLGDQLESVATILGGVIAALALVAAAREVYARSLGRRRAKYRRLARLGTGAQISFFASVLGEPPAMRRSLNAVVDVYDESAKEMVPTERVFDECFWIDDDFYVQTLSDGDGTVRAFSVTARNPRFNPTFIPHREPSRRERKRLEELTGHVYRPLFRVTLGKTRYAESGIQHPTPALRARAGARTFDYTEVQYLANPGSYQHAAFTTSTPSGLDGAKVVGLAEEIGSDWRGLVAKSGEEPPETLTAFRGSARITTYTLLGPGLSPDDYPLTYGPHGDEVRTIS